MHYKSLYGHALNWKKKLFSSVKGKLQWDREGDFSSFTLCTSVSACLTVILYFYSCN